MPGALPGTKRSEMAASIALPLVVGLCALPLFLTPVLPFVDFYNHIARYYLLGNWGDLGTLEAAYAPAWRLLPNLGLDILGSFILGWLPPLAAAKVIAALMMYAPFAGCLYLAHALHGRLHPLNVFLAGIAVFSFILIFGFANFLIGTGLALFNLGLWVRLQDRPRLQLASAWILGLALFFTHGLAFAMWGLLLGAVELMLAAERRALQPRALAVRMLRLASIAIIPFVLFTQMTTAKAEGGVTEAFVNLAQYAEAGQFWPQVHEEILQRVDTFLRVADSGLPWVDRFLGLLMWSMLAAGLVLGPLRLDRRLWLAAAMMGILVPLMPPYLFGVGYLDERAPLLLLLLLAAGLRLEETGAQAQRLVTAFAVLFLVRTGLLGIGWYQDGQIYRQFLTSLQTHQTGRVGVPAYFDGTGDRDARTALCAPLSHVMLLQSGTAVPAFANVTQQPLRLAGDLELATKRTRHIRTDLEPPDTITAPEARKAVLAELTAAGFDTIVTCDRVLSDEARQALPTGLREIARGDVWTLYVTDDARRPSRAPDSS